MNFYTVVIFSCIAGCIFSCKPDEVKVEEDCTGITVNYTNDIKPVLDLNCALSGCHNSSTRAEGYDLSTFAGASTASKNAAFLGSVRHEKKYHAMPHDAPKLDDATIKKLACWVKSGSPE